MRFRFAYKWITTPDLDKMAKGLIRADADRFRKWYDRKVHKNSLDRDFRVWWRVSGPTGFTNHEDTRRYMGEMWDLVQKDHATDSRDSAGADHSHAP